MGQNTDAAIAAWRERAGIQEHSQDYLAWLRELKKRVHELSEILVLEQSGIRDGDGFWHGSDPVDGTLHEITMLYKQRAIYAEPEKKVGDGSPDDDAKIEKRSYPDGSTEFFMDGLSMGRTRELDENPFADPHRS